MIKKILHIICAIAFSALFSALLAWAFYYFYLLYYRINLYNLQTYKSMLAYWNSGATLTAKDLLMLFGLLLFIPLSIWGWYKIYQCKFMGLITTPLEWLSNLGFSDYKVPSINIKNLKVEEKKSLEQFVQERIDIEKKKNPQPDSAKFRQDIIDKIEEEKNNQI